MWYLSGLTDLTTDILTSHSKTSTLITIRIAQFHLNVLVKRHTSEPACTIYIEICHWKKSTGVININDGCISLTCPIYQALMLGMLTLTETLNRTEPSLTKLVAPVLFLL